MTTEKMEVYSIEEGDTIYLNDELFFVQVIEPASSTESVLWVVDEEGFQRSIVVKDTEKFPVVIDTLAEV
jgi:hypothetical protein